MTALARAVGGGRKRAEGKVIRQRQSARGEQRAADGFAPADAPALFAQSGFVRKSARKNQEWNSFFFISSSWPCVLRDLVNAVKEIQSLFINAQARSIVASRLFKPPVWK